VYNLEYKVSGLVIALNATGTLCERDSVDYLAIIIKISNMIPNNAKTKVRNGQKRPEKANEPKPPFLPVLAKATLFG